MLQTVKEHVLLAAFLSWASCAWAQTSYTQFWTDRVNVAVNADNSLSKTASGSDWDAGASSYNRLKAGVDGTIEFTIRDLTSRYEIGLSSRQYNDLGWYSIDFGVLIENSTLKILERANAATITIASLSVGDVIKISKEGPYMRYYYNGQLLRGAAVNTTLDFCVRVVQASGVVPTIRSSFTIPQLMATPFVKSPGFLNQGGSIAMNPLSPTGNPSVSWSSGEQTASITGKQRGTYVATVSAAGSTLSRSISLGYKTYYSEATLVTEDQGELVKPIGGTGAWDAGARSLNVLSDSVDGWIEFVATGQVSTYAVGFATVGSSATVMNRFFYGLLINGSGSVSYSESAIGRTLTTWEPGDVFRIAREGSEIKYYKNGVVVRTVTTDIRYELWEKTAVYSGRAPVVTCSFDLRLRLKANVSSTGRTDGSGGVSIEAIGGNAPYTYSWSTGETSTSVSSKNRGTYTVTVTDSEGRTRSGTYRIGYKTVWVDLVNVQESQGILTKNTAVVAWNGGANSSNTLPPNTDGWIEFVASNEFTMYQIGFGLNRQGFDFDADFLASFNCQLVNGYVYSLRSYERSTLATLGEWGQGDVFRIVREGSSFKYYKNGVLIRTSAANPADELYVKTSVYSGSAPKVTTSFDAQVMIRPSIRYTGYQDGTGSIAAYASGGTSPYTYNWSSGESVDSVGGKSRGNYQIVVTDAEGRSTTRTYAVGYRLSAINLTGTSLNDDILNKTPNVASWSAGCNGSNVVLAGADGWIEFVLNQGSIFEVGFGANRAGFGNTDFRYGIMVNHNQLTVYENGTVTNIGGWRPGDVLRIARVGSEIRYSRNQQVLRTLVIGNAESLYPKISIYSGKAPRIALSSDATIQASVSVRGTVQANGSIAVKPFGGDAPYRFSWSTGEQVDSVGAKVRGSYVVTVTDNAGRTFTRTYSIGYPVAYTGHTFVNEVDGRLSRIGSAGWTSGALSYNILPGNADGWLEFVVDGSAYYGIGFSYLHSGQAVGDFRNVILVNNSTNLASAYEVNGSTVSLKTVLPGDVLRISREGTSVRYFINGNIERTITVDPKFDLIVKAAINTGSNIPRPTTSFDQMVLPVAIVRGTPGTGPSELGSIVMSPVGGTSPYTYTWTPQNQGTGISGPRGTYSVQVRDALSRMTTSRNITIGYYPFWTDAVGVIENDNLLTKTGGTGYAIPAGANSENTLASSTDGWIEIIPNEETKSTYIIGFADDLTTFSSTSFRAGIGVNQPYRTITAYERVSSVSLGSYVPGDVLRIIREGNTVKYYRNGSLLRTSTISTSFGTIALRAKTVISSGTIARVTTSFPIPAGQGQVPDATEFQVLKQIYDSLGGAAWTNKTNWPTSWPASATSTQYATWFGVTVENGDITALNFPSNNLIGKIPDAVIKLTQLLKVNLFNNKIAGKLPLQVGLLYKLKELNLAQNNIAGGLPASVGNLTALEQLLLARNALTGNLPDVFSRLKSLKKLDVCNNLLTGSLPATVDSLRNLTTLALANNQFSGPFPVQITRLVQLDTLILHKNQFTGNIPTTIANLTKLSRLSLGYNQFQGSTPLLEGVTTLQDIQLQNNQLSGTLPSNWSALSNLKIVNLGNNQFSGTLPSSWGSLTALREVALDSNQIAGPVPSPYASWTQLRKLVLSSNQLTGNPFDIWGNTSSLQEIDLRNNTFSGPIPASISGMTQLTTLQLSGNAFSGTLPAGLAAIPTLYLVDIENNEITSPGNFSTSPNKTNLQLKLASNRIAFGDVDANMLAANQPAVKSLTLAPQKSFNDITKITVSAGAALKIQARNAGQQGNIVWEWRPNSSANWTVITNQNQDATNKTLQLNNFSAAQVGWYRYRMTNTLFPGVELVSIDIEVRLGDYTVQWMNLSGVAVDGDKLSKNIADGWNAGANGANLLKANENGVMSFVMSDNSSRYAIGFTASAPVQDLSSLLAGIVVTPGQPLSFVEDGNLLNLTSAQLGDTIRIVRDGDSLRTFVNRTPLRAIFGDRTLELRPKAVVYHGATPAVKTSFDIQLFITPSIIPTSAAGTGGGISVAPLSGVAPFTYQWQGGEQSGSVTGKPVGRYQLTVQDAAGRSRIIYYPLGHRIAWTSTTQVSQNAGVLTKSVNTAAWNAGAVGYNIIPAGQDGWLSFVINNTTSQYLIGFATGSDVAETATVDYGLSVEPGLQRISLWEKGTNGISAGQWQEGDVLVIARVGATIKYYRNNQEIKSLVTNPALELRIKALVYTGQTPVIYASADAQIILQASITPVKNYGLNGSIAIQALSPAAVTYSWSSGEATATLQGKGPGTYTLNVNDSEGRTVSRTYTLGYQVGWTDFESTTASGNQLTRTSGEGWDAGANSVNTIKAGSDGWLEFVVESNSASYLVGLAPYSGIFNTAAFQYGIALQGGTQPMAWESSWNGINLSSGWRRGDVFKIERVGNAINYYKNSTLLRSVPADPSQELRIKALVYDGTLGLVQASSATREYAYTALNDSTTTYTIPRRVKVSLEGVMPQPSPAPAYSLQDVQQGDTKAVFPGCPTGRYIVGFQLDYDLMGDRNTANLWDAYVQVTLFHGEDSVWSSPLRVRMKDQTLLATAFYDSAISCDGNYFFHVDFKELEGNVPQDKIQLKVLLYKQETSPFVVDASYAINCQYDNNTHETVLAWSYSPTGTKEYDIEWVFIEEHEQFTGTTPAEAFAFREPARVTVTEPYYKHQVYYPNGRLWYRLRAVGYSLTHPDHRIAGQWQYGCSGVAITNHQPDLNWQAQTVFAEEGKYKKVMNYADGTGRQLQSLTNLSTEGVTLVGETKYDFEGRPAVNILPVPATDASLRYKAGFNQFAAIDPAVAQVTASGNDAYHFDNRNRLNSVMSTQSGAGQYYSPNNVSNSVHRDYIPDANGYVYAQTEYMNDGTGRVARQSGVGETFRMDSTHNTRYYYGTAAPEELARLFGSNVGEANHYKKNLVVDPNGQVSVSYLDQENRVIATALAGDVPQESGLAPLPSYTAAAAQAPLTIDLSTKNKRQEGVSRVTHKIMNTVPQTAYTFQYDLKALGADLEGFGCVSCLFDVVITLTDPDGAPYALGTIAGNEDTGGMTYRRTNLTADQCQQQLTNTISFTVLLREIGDYTLTKTLVPHELSFTAMKEMVSESPLVKARINAMRNNIVIDSAFCALCDECDVDQAINETIEEIADQDCSNIYRQMEADWQVIYAERYRADHNGANSEEVYIIPEDSIRQHALWCQYELCMRDKPSDIFEKQIARVQSWQEAQDRGYTNLFQADPFFKPGLTGFGSVSDMQNAINDYLVATVNGRVYRGPIQTMTDPNNHDLYINFTTGDADPNGYHLLYVDLMRRRNTMTAAAYQAELDRQWWTLYRSFYLEAKRSIVKQISDYQNCAPMLERINTMDVIPTNVDDLLAWGEQNGAFTVTDAELSMTISTMQFACPDMSLPAADSTAIAGHLRTYFSKDPAHNYFRIIYKSDVGVDPSLIAIDNILRQHGCAIDSVSLDDPLTCVRQETTLLEQSGSSGGGGGGDTEEPIWTDRVSGDASAVDMTTTGVAALQEELTQGILSEISSGATGSSGARVAMMSLASVATPDPAEINALVAFYNATSGSTKWTNKVGWADAAAGNPNAVPLDDWTGISVDNDGHVVAIDLPANGVIGNIPDDINQLTHLQVLNLSANASVGRTNQVTGLPSHFTGLTALRILNLKGNRAFDVGESMASIISKLYPCHATLELLDISPVFTSGIEEGPLPAMIGDFSNLQYLSLRGHWMPGGLPQSIYTLTNLRLLDLTNCYVGGPLSSAIGNLTNLQYLQLAGNNFTGVMPASIGSLVGLYELDFGANTFEGTIPASIGNLSNITTLSLAGSGVSGPIPDQLWNLTTLTKLYMHAVPMNARIPDAIGNLLNLTILTLDDCKLYGEVPASIGNLSKLVTLSFSRNDLDGIAFNFNQYTSSSLRLEAWDNRFTQNDLIKLYQTSGQIVSKQFYLSPQQKVEYSDNLPLQPGATITLSTTIDRNTTPPSTYQWFKTTAGGDVALTSNAANNHTLVVGPVTTANNGEKYFYTIDNPQTGVTLFSNPDTFVVLGPRDSTVCVEYDQNNNVLKQFQYTIDFEDGVKKCLRELYSRDSLLMEQAIEKYLNQQVTLFNQQYRTRCFEQVQESLTYTYQNKEYHYTLYYYDQAANLVQTVPPEGVRMLGDAAIRQVIAGNTVLPSHQLLTRYRYNSQNQLVWQHTPDAGQLQFWYNDKGQLRASQNAQQFKDHKYSYTRFDAMGRTIEVGEMNLADNLPADTLAQRVASASFPEADAYVLTDITRTHYDLAKPGFGRVLRQQYLRNRVAYVEMLEKDHTDTIATYYSYDVHGNVKSLVQQVPGLGYKRMDYAYDLVSSKVNFVFYQYNQPDEFIHRYTYDADNRIRVVQTSSDGFIWNRDAQYSYYQHGPLGRTVLGEYAVQGLDYVYTLQGWIKGVNGVVDPGGDGAAGSAVPKDEYSYTLGYYRNDYHGIGLGAGSAAFRLPQGQYETTMQRAGLFNGNIGWMTTDLKKIGEIKGQRDKGMQAMLYQYDQLNRLVKTRSLTQYSSATGFGARSANPEAYDEDYTYDANGNILGMDRRDEQGNVLHDFDYAYYRGSNRLRQIVPVVRDTVYEAGPVTSNLKVYRKISVKDGAYVPVGHDVTIKAIDSITVAARFDVAADANFQAYVLPEDEGMYLYDAIGNLIWDQEQGVKINWTPYGKVLVVEKGTDSTKVTFRYDASGQRIEKRVQNPRRIQVTHYIRDASGIVMATYQDSVAIEQVMYGSSRVGIYKGNRRAGYRTLGMRQMELANHLGNVLVVTTDNLQFEENFSSTLVRTSSDYYPFGAIISERLFNSDDYTYGFNGKEKDSAFGSIVYDYGFRIYDPRIAKFLSVDPLSATYPFYSPYQFASNCPVFAVDIDGLEADYIHNLVERFFEGMAGDEMNTPKGQSNGVFNTFMQKKVVDYRAAGKEAIRDPVGTIKKIAASIKQGLKETKDELLSGDPERVAHGAGRVTGTVAEALAPMPKGNIGKIIPTKIKPVLKKIEIDPTVLNGGIPKFRVKGVVGKWLTKVNNVSEIPYGCEKVADRVVRELGDGAQYLQITPKNLRYLGTVNKQDSDWYWHVAGVKEGRVFDKLTGSEGMDIEDYKALFDYNEDLNFEIVSKRTLK